MKICNFQSHRSTVLEFSRGINVICGRSTSGKTAIIRAIQWLITNRPLGLRFFSNFAKETESTQVSLVTEEGNTIKLTKSGSGSEYFMDGPPYDRELWSGIGASIPDLVTKALNIDETNVQNQLDEHFLITSSPGEVARVLNQITKIEKVDGWISSLTSDINSKNRDTVLLNGQILELKKSLDQYESLDQFKKKIEEAQSIYDRISDIDELSDIVEDILLEIRESSDKLKSLAKFLDADVLVKEAEDILYKLLLLEEEFQVLSDYVSVDSKYTDMNTDLVEFEALVLTAMGFQKDYSNCDSKIYSVNNVLVDLRANAEKEYSIKEKLSVITEAATEFLVEEGKCPLCLSKIDSKKAVEIMETWA